MLTIKIFKKFNNLYAMLGLAQGGIIAYSHFFTSLRDVCGTFSSMLLASSVHVDSLDSICYPSFSGMI